MSSYVETFRGVVYPWHCDHLGHMNVKNYVGMFDQAAFHFLAICGFSFHDMEASGETIVDARHTIEYKVEQRAGALIRIDSAFVRLGGKSVTARHRMWNTETGDLAATSEIVGVYFDLGTRQSIPIPDTVRERMAPLLAQTEES